MKKKGSKKLSEKERPDVAMVVRFTESEMKQLRQLTSKGGHVYPTRVVRMMVVKALEESK